MDSDIQKNVYNDYIKEIEERKTQGLHPKPIDGAELLDAIIAQIKDSNSPYREDSLKFFIYNTLPGTTPAAGVKAKFLKEIILGESVVSEITPARNNFVQHTLYEVIRKEFDVKIDNAVFEKVKAQIQK